MLELGRHDSFLRQTVAEISARERTLGPFLPMNHQMVQIENLTGPRVMAVAFGIIAEVFVGHDDVVPVLLVLGQFVDGIAYAVTCFMFFGQSSGLFWRVPGEPVDVEREAGT